MAGVQHREPIHLAFLRGRAPLRPCRHARLLRVKWPCPSAPDALRRAQGMVQKLLGDSARKRASTQEPCIQEKRWDHVAGGSVTGCQRPPYWERLAPARLQKPRWSVAIPGITMENWQ